jgi:hypothetical protein
MDLPPELRSRIYDFYFMPMEQAIVAPAQPPLAQLCRLLRQEVLPHFYSSKTIVVQCRRSTIPASRTKFLLLPESGMFLAHLNDEDVAAIRSFVISLGEKRHLKDKPPSFREACRLAVQLDNLPVGYKVQITGGQAWYLSPYNLVERLEGMDALLHHKASLLLEWIVARPTQKKLLKEDIYELRNAAEEAYK